MAQGRDGSDFEGYRRNRRRHQVNAGVAHKTQRSPVLRELEAAEAQELRNERMSREVHEFFSDATRTAAEIVARVSKEQENEHGEHVSHDMLEFLADAIARAQDLVTQLQSRSDLASVGAAEIEANLHNIVGRQLDEFRREGTAQLHDKHIGQDPFAATDQGAATNGPSVEGEASPVEIEEHLVADFVGDEESSSVEVEIPEWIRRLRGDPKRLAASLKMLVSQGVLSKDEALSMFYALTPIADK